MNLLNLKYMNMSKEQKAELLRIINLCNDYFKDQWKMYKMVYDTNGKYSKKVDGKSPMMEIYSNISSGANGLPSYKRVDYLYDPVISMFDLDNFDYNSHIGVPFEMSRRNIDLDDSFNEQTLSRDEFLNRAKVRLFRHYNQTIKKVVYGYFANLCTRIPYKLVEDLDNNILWEHPEDKVFDVLNKKWHTIAPFEEFNHFVEKKNAIMHQQSKVSYINRMKSNIERLRTLPKDLVSVSNNGIKFHIHKPQDFDQEYKYKWYKNMNKIGEVNNFINGLIYYLHKYYNLNFFNDYKEIDEIDSKVKFHDAYNTGIESIRVYQNGSFILKFDKNWCRSNNNLNRLFNDFEKVIPLKEDKLA